MRDFKKIIIALVTFTSLIASGVTSHAQLVANSLSELRTYGLTVNNTTVTLSSTGGDPHPETGIVTPGTYWINGDHYTDPTNSIPIFMELSGTGNTYNLGGATIKLDTRKLDGFGRNLGHDSGIDVIKITGSNNVVNDINLIGEDIALNTDPNAQRYADWATQYVVLSGDSNTVDGANIVTRGSLTEAYGLGDSFGKGASQGISPYILHRKASAFRVGEATNAVVNDMHLQVNTFGHGFFVQTSTDTTLTNSTITGELFSTNDVINHPLYQEHGHAYYGKEIPADQLISGAEGGVRMYTGSSGLTVDSVVVTNMRTGFATTLGSGEINLNNVEAYGVEGGAFGFRSNTTITNAKADAINGPVFIVDNASTSNSSIDIEIVDNGPIIHDDALVYLSGNNVEFNITSSIPAEDFKDLNLFRSAQFYWNNWRESQVLDGPEVDGYDFTNSTFNNNTHQYFLLGEQAEDNTGYSLGPVVTNGKNNSYDGLSVVLSGTNIIASHANGLGNNGTAADGSLETNASFVELGGTLEISPGIRITNEKLTISGNGNDNQGALYSDGSVDSGTRFGSSNSSDESTIFLAGDASIGVGIAGNQMLIGSLQGTGNFTKRGAGILSIEKATTFDGSFTVAEGQVVARSNVVNGNLTVNAGASIAGISDDTFNTSGTVFIYGTLDINARDYDTNMTAKLGTLFGPGSIVASNPEVTGNNELTLATQSFGYYLGSVEDNVNLIKEGVGTQVLAGSSTYTGTTTVNEGFLLIDGTHSGGDDYFINEGGTLGGFGTIGSEVIITSGGVLSPGASAGILTVEAADFQSGSTFEIEIGGTSVGTQFDQLSAADLALGGTLEVSFLNAFTPDANDVFTIATSSNLSGEFENVADGERIQTAGGEGSFLVIYNSSSDTVILSSFLVDTGLLEGDFNRDGTVDAADYTVWRDSFGATGLTPYDGADADGDGEITQLDYNLWVANYGETSSSSTSTAVPEPTAVFVMITLLAIPACKNRS